MFEDLINRCNLVNVLLLDLLTQTCNLLLLLLRRFVLLLSEPLSDLVFFSLLLGRPSSLNLISIGLHLILVNISLLHHVVADQSVWIGTVRAHLTHELCCLLEQPWHHISFHNILIKSVSEMTDITKKSERIDLDIFHELFAKDPANDLLVRHLFGLTSATLQCLLCLIGFQAFRL